MPDPRTYGDRRPYAVPDTFAELTGPPDGQLVLSPDLGWTGRTHYDLDDTADTAVLYERILTDAVHTSDVTALINADRLRALWPTLFLPERVRRLWESRFPELNTARGPIITDDHGPDAPTPDRHHPRRDLPFIGVARSGRGDLGTRTKDIMRTEMGRPTE